MQGWWHYKVVSVDSAGARTQVLEVIQDGGPRLEFIMLICVGLLWTTRLFLALAVSPSDVVVGARFLAAHGFLA